MATVNAEENSAVEAPVSGGLKPITRLEQEEQAEKRAEAISLPKSPGRLVEYEVMKAWLDSLTPAQWENVAIYLYRSYPKIMREQVAENLDHEGKAVKYIDCIYDPFTKEDIVSNHGGGRYIFWVNDVGASKKRETIFKSRLNISMDEADPILNPAELDWACKENQPYINKMRALGKIRGQEFVNPITQSAQGSATEHSLIEKLLSRVLDAKDDERERMRERNPDNIILEKAIESAQKGSERSLDFMVKQLEASKREDPAGMLIAVAQLIKEFRPQEKSNDSTLIVAMMTNQMELTKLMLQQNAPKEKEEGDEFSKLKNLLEIARELKGGKATEGGWLDKAIEHGTPVLGKIVDTINNVLILRRSGVPMQQRQANPGQQQQPQAPQPTRAGIPGGWGDRATARHIAAEPGPQPVMEPTAGQDALTPEQEFVVQYGGLVLQNMQGSTGDEFAAWVSEGLGPAAFINIKKMGKEKVLAAMKSVPDFWDVAMTNFEEHHVTKFVDDFFSFDPYKQDEEEEGE